MTLLKNVVFLLHVFGIIGCWCVPFTIAHDRLSFRCDGSLINDKYVLTAAHCITESIAEVRLGEHYLRTDIDCNVDNEDDCATRVQDYTVAEKIPHAQYDSTKLHHDIGLLRLSSPANLDVELNLDYLEHQNEEGGNVGRQEIQGTFEINPESVDLVKVIIMGASSVGKTSIIQQFVWNDFTTDYQPTDRKHTYYQSVITKDHLYEIKITDIPVLTYFPTNSFYEWSEYRYYGLRNATAYILVFDLSNLETFQHIRTLRDQLYESRNMSNVPLLVVGNKQDLLSESESEAKAETKSTMQLALLPNTSQEKRRDIANLVKKHWRCGYVECSAKYNWRIVAIFKELMSMIDAIEQKEQTPIMDNIQDALDRNKCTIL